MLICKGGAVGPLRDAELESFMSDGFVRLDAAFSNDQAQAAASALLDAAGIDSSQPATWPGPVLRLDGSLDPIVVETINSPRLRQAIDQLVGSGNWQRRESFGTFPIRFPSASNPGDAGWHIDGSFGQPPHYQVNLASRGRALLLLMLFTDVDRQDAPTRLRVGSHTHVARALATMRGDVVFAPGVHAPATLHLPIELATGAAGTVFLCHPFLVHAASWPHTGQRPRVIAQPAIHHRDGEGLGGFDYNTTHASPVVRSIQSALKHPA